MNTNLSVGLEAERIAYLYLSSYNLKYINNNYYTRYGEIDLIMKDREAIVFVEVKYRKNSNFGHPVEAITKSKQDKILNSAYCFMNNHKQYSKSPYRFDAVTLLEIKNRQQNCLANDNSLNIHRLESKINLDYETTPKSSINKPIIKSEIKSKIKHKDLEINWYKNIITINY